MMKLDITPWGRMMLGPAAIEELCKAPDEYEFHLGKGTDGWTVRLWDLSTKPKTLLVELYGQKTALGTVETVLATLRERVAAA